MTTAKAESPPKKRTTVTKRCTRSKKSLAKPPAHAPRKRSRVTFNTSITTQQIDAADERDIQESWYSGDDYSVFEEDCTHTIAAIRKAFTLRQKGNDKTEYRLNPKEYTAKGLEDLLSIELKRHRGFLKGRHHHHVLMEHSMQRSHGVVDMDNLAAVSQMFSAENCHIALERGHTKDY